MGAFTGSQLDAVADITGDAATCDCSCGAAQVDCGDLNLLYRQSCGQPVGVELFAQPDTCHDNTPQQNSTNPFFVPLEETQACPPSPTAEVPPGSSTAVRIYGGTFEQAECGPGEQCIAAVPTGFEPRLCIARSGVHDCPPAYPEQEVVFIHIADNRGCTACDCTPDAPFECASTLQLYSGDECGALTGTVDTDQCVASWGSFEFAAPTVTGSCTPSESTAMGEAVGAAPTTICCD